MSRWWRRRALLLGAALLLVWAALPRAPTSLRHDLRFPSVTPDALAHYLADFSNQLLVSPHPESWKIESEQNNITWWHYDVSYSCGPRCSGRAAVTAVTADGGLAVGGGHGGGPAAHRVLAVDTHCTQLLPLLPWPTLCEVTEMDVLVEADGAGGAAGARLTETAAVSCSPLQALLGRCPGEPELAARHRLRLRALSAALGPAH